MCSYGQVGEYKVISCRSCYSNKRGSVSGFGCPWVGTLCHGYFLNPTGYCTVFQWGFCTLTSEERSVVLGCDKSTGWPGTVIHDWSMEKGLKCVCVSTQSLTYLHVFSARSLLPQPEQRCPLLGFASMCMFSTVLLPLDTLVLNNWYSSTLLWFCICVWCQWPVWTVTQSQTYSDGKLQCYWTHS